MTSQIDITPLFLIPGRNPELHWELIGLLRSELEGLNGEVAPIWVHPSHPNLSREPEELPEKAHAAWRSGGEEEIFALAGYVGAPHPALPSEEARLEIDWARRNPWSGAAESYALAPGYFAPLVPDTGRRELLSGERVVLYAATSDEEGERLVYTVDEAVYSLPLFRLAPRHREVRKLQLEFRRFLRRARRRGEPGVLLLRLTDPPEEVGLLRQLSDLVNRRSYLRKRLRLAPFDPFKGRREQSRAVNASLLRLPLGGSPFGLEVHRGLRQAAAERNEPGENQDRRREVLRSFVEPKEQERSNDQYGKDRVYTAAMHGYAEIVGDRFSVRTEDGRPATLVTESGVVGLDLPATTSVRLAGGLAPLEQERCRVESVTAFSFEGPISRGIREETILEGELSGRIRLDTYFIDGYGELYLSMEARVQGSPEQGVLLTPVELPIRDLTSATYRGITLLRRFAGGNEVEEQFGLEPREAIPLFGEELIVKGGGGGELLWAPADLRSRVIAPAALLRGQTAGGNRVDTLMFAPFGSVLFRPGRRQELSVRRSVRLAPARELPHLGTLREALVEELLFWEGREE